MAGLIIVLILIITVLVGYLMLASSATGVIRPERPPTEEELLQARLDLHRVERGVDLALAKQDQRREAERVKEAIAETLGGGRP